MNERTIIGVYDGLNSTSTTDALSANMGRELNDTKQDKIIDTGWIDVPLSNGVVIYDVINKPQYRKIGNVVYLRGAVKNITERGTTIGILPEGYRPVSMSHNYVQLTSIQGNSANFTRMKVSTNGAVVMESISSGITATYHEDNWYPIHTSFPIE